MNLPRKSNYKSNINFEMNYWGAQSFNLSECNLPYIALVKSLVVPGRKTARAYYNAPGWSYAVMTDAWGWTSPRQGMWGASTADGSWALQNFWEHYAFTRDEAYLRSVYPVMKEACDFYLAVLVPDKKGGPVMSPGSSPEKKFPRARWRKGRHQRRLHL